MKIMVSNGGTDLLLEHEWAYIQKRKDIKKIVGINEKVNYVFEISPSRVLMFVIDEDDEMNHLIPEDEFNGTLKFWRSNG